MLYCGICELGQLMRVLAQYKCEYVTNLTTSQIEMCPKIVLFLIVTWRVFI